MSIKIVSLNCWYGRIHAPLLEYLKQVDADVYCLQEVYSSAPNTPQRVEFTWDVSPEEPIWGYGRLYSEIQALLPNHRGTFYPAMQNLQKGSGTGEHLIGFGTACFIKNNLSVMGERAEFVCGSFRSDGWGVPPMSRIGHCVRLWRNDVSKPIVVAHMHGTWIPKVGKIEIPERTHQATALCSIIESVRDHDDDTVVCGDFNVLPGSETFKIFGQLGLTDLVVGRGFADTRTSLYKKTERFADYMLVSPELRVQAFDIPATPEVSDHRPLVLVCE